MRFADYKAGIFQFLEDVYGMAARHPAIAREVVQRTEVTPLLLLAEGVDDPVGCGFGKGIAGN